jgi:hypothetical protein
MKQPKAKVIVHAIVLEAAPTMANQLINFVRDGQFSARFPHTSDASKGARIPV